MFGRKRKTEQPPQPVTERKPYDPAVYKAVLKCSICNGEQVAGFKNRQTGKFEEVAFIRNDRELDEFMRLYGLDRIDKEY
ncbi:MAG: aspartate dehydrogenase [Lachnospiraceae bacterium]|nr:aspartate dehydrogenase [Lachnospiraceae bacterium]